MEQLTLTTLNDLQAYSQGQLVELPEFAVGQPFVAKLRRPSLLALAKSGKIPNELIGSASKMFSSGKASEKDEESVLSQMYDMLEVICEASFVSPTYQEIKDAGVELTDEQRTFVFNYAQTGVRALSNFRTE